MSKRVKLEVGQVWKAPYGDAWTLTKIGKVCDAFCIYGRVGKRKADELFSYTTKSGIRKGSWVGWTMVKAAPDKNACPHDCCNKKKKKC